MSILSLHGPLLLFILFIISVTFSSVASFIMFSNSCLLSFLCLLFLRKVCLHFVFPAFPFQAVCQCFSFFFLRAENSIFSVDLREGVIFRSLVFPGGSRFPGWFGFRLSRSCSKFLFACFCKIALTSRFSRLAAHLFSNTLALWVRVLFLFSLRLVSLFSPVCLQTC